MEFTAYKNGQTFVMETRNQIRTMLTINKKGGCFYYKDQIIDKDNTRPIFSLYSGDENPEFFQTRMAFNKDGKGTIFYLDPESNILYRGEGAIGISP